MVEQRAVVQLKEVPKTYIAYMAEYSIPYTIGIVGGAFLKNGVSQATLSLPRILGLGIDDAVTIGTGVAAIMQGTRLIGKWSLPVGAGIITSWILGKIFGLGSMFFPGYTAGTDLQALAGFFDPEGKNATTFTNFAMN